MSPGLTKNPLPQAGDLLSPAALLRSRIFPGRPVRYTMNGRNAIHMGLAAAGLRPGDVVLLPAFHCTALVEPVLAFGARAVYYAVGRDLSLDLDALEAQLKRTGARALLCVHFFGWPAPIRALREICDRQGAALIEDCTHSLFGALGEEPLGSFGDVSVFSFRKTLPVQDGGALVANRPSKHFAGPHRFAPWPYQLRMLKWTLEASRAGAFALEPEARATAGTAAPTVPATTASASSPASAASAASAAKTAAARRALGSKGPDSQEDPAFAPECLRFPMSMASRLLLGAASPRDIVAARRRNYAYLAERLAGLPDLKPCFPDLPAGVCPMGFPFLAGDGAPGSRWDYRLRGLGVPAFSFGEELHATLDRAAFPDALHLSARLAMLPVHQGLTETDLERMASLAETRLAGKAP